MKMFFDFEEMITSKNPPYFMFAALGFMGIGFLWAFICLFIYSWLEGAYGQTPGKWVAGIKVMGMDMNPCGFGRALIRNLLKFVDSFFNFIVGVMIVALTEHWQRVGDLAARTIVVDIRADQ